VNILNKQSRTADKGWSSSLVVGRGAKNSPLLKHILLRNIHRRPRTWTDTLVTTLATKEGHEIRYLES